MIQKPYLLELARAFAGDRDLGDPLISPQHADLAGLPPLLIQVGSEETLLDDAVTLAGRAGAAGVAVTLEVWPEMIHAFPMFFPRVAASRRATDRRRRLHARPFRLGPGDEITAPVGAR